MQTKTMSQVRDPGKQITIGELSKWSVADRCKLVLDGDAELLRLACTQGALHPQCRDLGFVNRLAWGIAFNTFDEGQAGDAEQEGKRRTYSDIWPPETPWSEVWEELSASCGDKRRMPPAKPGPDAPASAESERYLHHLARSISCEHRDDWQPPQARPIDSKAAGAAFSTLFQSNEKFVLAIVKSQLPGEGGTEHDEVVNDAFMRAFSQYWHPESHLRFIGRSKISSLLYRITRNACVDFLRRKGEEIHESNSLEFLPANTGPLSDTEAAELRRRMKKCLRELKPKQALVYYLVNRRKIPQKELAKRLGVTPAAINQWLKAATTHVEAFLAEAI